MKPKHPPRAPGRNIARGQVSGKAPDAAQPPSTNEIDAAIAIWKNSKTQWHDADVVFQELVRDGIKLARRTRKISRGLLGKRAGLYQPQISRVEKNPENITLGVLRRIADALAKAPPPSPAAKLKTQKQTRTRRRSA